ncbi:UNVERIFIED_CONTAM: anaphase-promoting complex subunit Hcn1 [Siphonaria sp. JEL0065]|nr:anaphase-promoting complex subunit Hcn1 [Siphonaria sp. JEL0065]
MEPSPSTQAFMSETVALQSYLMSLQKELSDGLSRVSRIVDLATKAGFLQESNLPSIPPPTVDRYQFKAQLMPPTSRALSLVPSIVAPIIPDANGASPPTRSVTSPQDIPTHVTIGLKWDSQDYIHAAKLDELKKSQDELAQPSPKKSTGTTGMTRFISRASVDSNDTLPLYMNEKKVAPELLGGDEIANAGTSCVSIIVGEQEAEPVENLPPTLVRKHSATDKLLSATRRRSSGVTSYLEGRRQSYNPPSNLQETSELMSKSQVVSKKAKWEKIRQQTLRESTPVQGRKLSSVLQAAFPEIQKKIREEKSARARAHWDKIRAVVMAPPDEAKKKKKNTKLAALMITVLPDIATLHAKIHAPIIQDKSVTPYDNFNSFLHWFFLCPAFDDRGSYIPIRKYHGVEYRKHKLLVDGLNPMSIFNSTIHLGIILLCLIFLILLPYQASFFDNVETQKTLSWIVSGCMVLDTVMNIMTPRKPPKTDSQFKLRRPNLDIWIPRYIRTHGVVDFITIIPWIQAIPFSEASLPLCLLILLRTMRLPSMMSRSPLFIIIHAKIESIGGIGNILARIIPVGITVIIFIHIQACVVYYVGRLTEFTTWDTQFDHWRLYQGGGGVESAPVFERYIWMLSQSMGNTFPMTFKPQTIAEQVTTLMFIVTGAILYATFVGLISSAAISFDASGKLYRQKIDELTDYLTWKNIDATTQRKLLNYYEFKYRGKYFEERSLLADMNESLRMELASINSRQLIEKVPFLKRDMKDGRDNIYLGKIATALNPIYFIPGDYIVNQGEQATEMFFILTGKVNIQVNGVVVTTFSDGAFFGEVALIANIPRTASVQAITTCHLYSLSAKDFGSIILEFDDMKQRIDQIYEERMAKVRMEQAAQMLMTNQS